MSAIEKMKAEAIAALPGPRAKNVLAEKLKSVNNQSELMALACSMIINANAQPETARAARLVCIAARTGRNLLLMEECLD